MLLTICIRRVMLECEMLKHQNDPDHVILFVGIKESEYFISISGMGF